MFQKVRFTTITRAFLLLVILLVSTGTFALAQEGGENGNIGLQSLGLPGGDGALILGQSVSPSQPTAAGGPGISAIMPMEFKSLDNPPRPTAYYSTFLYNPEPSISVYAAKLNVPQGATLTKMTVYLLNTSAAEFRVTLLRCPWVNLECVLLTDHSMKATSSEMIIFEDTTITNPVVDWSLYTYMLLIRMPPSPEFFNGGVGVAMNGIRLDYGYPISLPAVMR